MKRLYNKFIDLFGIISGVLLVVVSLFVFANVVCRLLGVTVAWLFDSCIICAIFMTYLGFFYVQRDKKHVNLDMVTSKVSPEMNKLMTATHSYIAILFSLFNSYMVYLWFNRVLANGLKATMAWNLPMWVFSAVMLFGWLMFLIVSAVQAVEESIDAVKACKGRTVLKYIGILAVLVIVNIICFKLHIVLGMFVLLLTLLFMGLSVALSMGVAAAISMYLVLGFVKVSAQFAVLSYQGLNSVGITAAPLFILGGSLMFESGCIDGIYRLLDGRLGKKVPGASLIVTCLTGLVFCAVTGSTVAATAVLAMLCLPVLRKRGYGDGISVGMIAGASVGTLVPPSNSFILIGLLTGLPIANIFMAGTLPAVILFTIYIVYAMVWAKVKGFQEIRVDETEITPEQKRKDRLLGIFGVLAPVICLGGLYAGLFTATEGGGVLVAYSLIVGLFITKTLNFEKIKKTMIGSVKTSLGLLFLLAMAQTYSGVLTQTGITTMAANFVRSLNLSANLFLVIYTVLLLILGMLLNAASITLILYPISIPIYKELGINPYFFAVYFTILCEVGALTPPVGINLFVIQGAGENLDASKVSKGSLPFLAMMMAVVILIWAFPNICTCLFS